MTFSLITIHRRPTACWINRLGYTGTGIGRDTVVGVEHWQKLRGMLAEEKISSYPVIVCFCCLRVVDGIRWDNQVLRLSPSVNRGGQITRQTYEWWTWDHCGILHDVWTLRSDRLFNEACRIFREERKLC